MIQFDEYFSDGLPDIVEIAWFVSGDVLSVGWLSFMTRLGAGTLIGVKLTLFPSWETVLEQIDVLFTIVYTV